MTRPMAVNSSEYLEFLKHKAQYKCFYPYMEWALDTLGSLEEKAPQEYFTTTDFFKFEKVKAIIELVNREIKEETRESHTTTHYIWRTQDDNKVRSNHAKFNGRVFSWDNAPPTGHPGEDYNCRCWAEPFTPRQENLREFVAQTVTSAAVDSETAWVREDFFHHYRHANGKMVRLSEIGHLHSIINHAQIYDQGGGSVFERVEKNIIRQARERGEGVFPYHFINSYQFQPALYELGNTTIRGDGSMSIKAEGHFLVITANVNYALSDMFTDPYDPYDNIPGEINIDGIPYAITGEWVTHIEAIVKK